MKNHEKTMKSLRKMIYIPDGFCRSMSLYRLRGAQNGPMFSGEIVPKSWR